jgi:O-glycosyl hydrolase
MNFENLFEAIQTDYDKWRERMGFDKEQMDVDVRVGRKYAKIVRERDVSVWGFVQLQDDDKFKAGDILMASSWSAPARNKARGNVLTGDLSMVQWQGPEYLRGE